MIKIYILSADYSIFIICFSLTNVPKPLLLSFGICWRPSPNSCFQIKFETYFLSLRVTPSFCNYSLLTSRRPGQTLLAIIPWRERNAQATAARRNEEDQAKCHSRNSQQLLPPAPPPFFFKSTASNRQDGALNSSPRVMLGGKDPLRFLFCPSKADEAIYDLF